MPRLPPRLFNEARNVHPLLPLVLRGTRGINAARNELRWMKEHIMEQYPAMGRAARHKLHHLCIQRARGKPLQYLLGTEYFGDLEITCEPGVLIPRQETAASVTHLVQKLCRLKSLPDRLRVLDLCTGTGCIPLLFEHEFRKQGVEASLEALGVDISSQAIDLARKNQRKVTEEGAFGIKPSHSSLQFVQADVLADRTQLPNGQEVPLMTAIQNRNQAPNDRSESDKKEACWDVLISNPPYISPLEFNRTTSRSVRNFEPKLALVPKRLDCHSGIDPGDIFYPRLLDIAKQVDAKAVLFEVADLEQAGRVAFTMQQQKIWSGIEIWRDYPGDDTQNNDALSDRTRIVGSGNGRSVFAWRKGVSAWPGLESA